MGISEIEADLNDGGGMNRCFHFASMLLDR